MFCTDDFSTLTPLCMQPMVLLTTCGRMHKEVKVDGQSAANIFGYRTPIVNYFCNVLSFQPNNSSLWCSDFRSMYIVNIHFRDHITVVHRILCNICVLQCMPACTCIHGIRASHADTGNHNSYMRVYPSSQCLFCYFVWENSITDMYSSRCTVRIQSNHLLADSMCSIYSYPKSSSHKVCDLLTSCWRWINYDGLKVVPD